MATLRMKNFQILQVAAGKQNAGSFYVKADDISDYGFPITNHIYSKYGNLYGYEDGPLSYLWTSYRSSDTDGTAYAMRIKKDGTVSLSSSAKANAASVRCVAE